ncbi:hypothetical protein AB1K70_26835 [Bremerella sp. JC770]|uniref:hypothetical protein n=1 Tax=Bremerella sp. JC770 TaxID=3232137 RepID=UPI003457929F
MAEDAPSGDDELLNASSWHEIDWEKCYQWMKRYAAKSISGIHLRSGTSSDVAQSALVLRFRKAIEDGEPIPKTTMELHALLVKDLMEKIKKRKNEARRKESQIIRESDGAVDDKNLNWLDSFVSGKPTKEAYEAFIADRLMRLHSVTNDPEILVCGELTLTYLRPKAIAEITGMSEHQVRRRLDKLTILLKTSDE